MKSLTRLPYPHEILPGSRNSLNPNSASKCRKVRYQCSKAGLCAGCATWKLPLSANTAITCSARKTQKKKSAISSMPSPRIKRISFASPSILTFFQNILPRYAAGVSSSRFTVWCAGCSSGEEPYTLAIVLSEFARQQPRFDFAILATDVSTKVLAQAQTGIYDAARVEPISIDLRRTYLLRSRDVSSPSCELFRNCGGKSASTG